eukprot:6179342-Pleurochrysis_carterae.AAC.1
MEQEEGEDQRTARERQTHVSHHYRLSGVISRAVIANSDRSLAMAIFTRAHETQLHCPRVTDDDESSAKLTADDLASASRTIDDTARSSAT